MYARTRLSHSGSTAELREDTLTDRGVVLFIDGAEQSHVEVGDPDFLLHDYLIRFSTLLTTTAPRLFNGAPTSILHLGAGALTLPLWVEHRWPHTRQTVVEIEPELVGFVLEHLPMRQAPELVTGDAADVLSSERATRKFDVVVVDLFNSAAAPARVTRAAFFARVFSTLNPQGLALVNYGDDADMKFARKLTATMLSATGDPATALLSAPQETLTATDEGNLVFAHSPSGFTQQERDRVWAAGPHPHGVLTDAELLAWTREGTHS
ncbi:spermidine synthase [Nesterenkonia alba]|uniref:spermidine synthase n=1 Tax=Nesterenkonia alba TaxID=515814 RepID=UPI0003B372C5|nr:fused MFS/spermidine synthase [Nesterenkonia alba]